MAKNVVAGKNEIKAKNIIMADHVVVNENEAKDEKKKDWSIGILAAIVIPLLGVAVTLFAVFYEKPKTFLPNPLLDQAEVLLVEEKYDEAIANAEAAKAVEADNPRIYLLIYAAHELSDRHDEAIQALQEGTQQVKKRATGGKEIRAVLAAAEVSPEEGLAAVADFYSSFDQLKNLAQKFLQLLVRVYEGSGRFMRALGETAKENAVVFNGSAYQVFDIGMTWHEAKAYCESLGGHLVTITSQEEQEHIRQLISSESKEAYWLGAKRSDNNWDEWEWISEEMFAYTNWADWEPNGSGAYMQMFAESGRWDDTLADVNYEGGQKYWNMGFICEWSS